MLHFVGTLEHAKTTHAFISVSLLPCTLLGYYIVLACHRVLGLWSLLVVHFLIGSMPRVHLHLKCPQGSQIRTKVQCVVFCICFEHYIWPECIELKHIWKHEEKVVEETYNGGKNDIKRQTETGRLTLWSFAKKHVWAKRTGKFHAD